jgi:hypothetical protein
MTFAARPALAAAIALLVSLAAPVAAQPEKTLDKCQKTAGKETAKYVGSRQKAFAKCLDKISAERIAAAAVDAAAAAKTCASSLRKVGNSEYPDKTLEAKFRAKVAKACDPAVNAGLEHTANDVLGGIGLVSGDQIDAASLGASCAAFGGDGSVDDIDEWLDCVTAAAECQADRQIGAAYPNVLAWLGDVRGDILALDPLDPANTDAVAVIDAVDDALDANDDEVLDLTCGSVPGVPCTTGRFSPTGNEPCLDCPAGTFQNQIGQSSCQPCGAGFFGATPAAASCQACPFGTFQDAVGQTSCQPCAPGTFADSTGLSACSPCAVGKFASASGLTACSNCSPGYFTDTTGAASCTACSPGRFANATGSTTCQPCSAGTFASSPAATSCTNCGAGTATSSSGQASCAACPPGTFAGASGLTSCTDCAPGRFASSLGQTACPQCAADTFAPVGRMIACAPCPGAPAGSAACTCAP